MESNVCMYVCIYTIILSVNMPIDARFIVNDISELNKTDVIHAPISFSWLKNYIWQLSDG